MKEITERHLKMNLNEVDEDVLSTKIESVAQEMAEEGWFFIESNCDGVLENLTLFFERDIEVE